MLQIKRTVSMGRGVFATQDIPSNILVLHDPVIIFPIKDAKGTLFQDYQFNWDEENCAIPLGLGSLINHNVKANCAWKRNQQYMDFYTLRNIKKGEQMFHDYGYDPSKQIVKARLKKYLEGKVK